MTTLAYFCVPLCSDCADQIRYGLVPASCSSGDVRCALIPRLGRPDTGKALAWLNARPGCRLRLAPSALARRTAGRSLRPAHLCGPYVESRKASHEAPK